MEQEQQEICSITITRSINDLPDSVLTEILSRLPTEESVMGCKSVCKQWNSLISSPDLTSCFITNHAADQGEYEKYITVVQDMEYRFQGMNVLGSDDEDISTDMSTWLPESSYYTTNLRLIAASQKNDTVSILASHNDLLLCVARGDSHHPILWSFYSGSLFLCNLFTMERLDLPETPIYGAVALMCEPYYRIDAQGRYHLRNSNRRFTILCVSHSFSEEEVSEVVQFCSETGTWSKPVGLELRLEFSEANIVAYKGKFYWVGNKRVANSTLEHVVVYDPSSGAGSATRFSRFPEIDRSWGRRLPACLGVCNGVLRVMRLFSRDRGGDDYGFTLCVWDLKDNNSSADEKQWSLEKCISIDQMISEEDSSVWRIVRSWPSYKGISLQAFDQSNEDIVYMSLDPFNISCNLRTRKLELLTQIPSHVGMCPTVYNRVFTLAQPWWPAPIVHNLCQESTCFSD